MKQIIKIFFCIVLIINSYSIASANLKYDHDSLKTKVYFSYNDKIGQDALVKGKIVSISTSEELPENELSGGVSDKSKVTVRLINREGLHENNTLYVIDVNNIVVSKLQIKYIHDSRTLGNILVGYGNFKLSCEGFRVVMPLTEKNTEDSYIFKSRGDYYYRTGDKGKAINEYKKAIEMDRSNPSARLGLGLVYFKDEVYNFAYAELFAAYKHISSLYDNEDRFILLGTLAQVCFIEAYKNTNLYEHRIRFRKEGIKYCKEAMKINKNSVDASFLLGEFYYRKIDYKTDEDKLAKDMFLKVLELNQSHSGANIRLAELYIKHNNRQKGLYYAKKAAEADPSNQKALEILKSGE